MTLFLLVFLLLYTGMHGYGYLKLRGAVRFTARRNLAVALFVALMVTMPITTRILEKSGAEPLARLTAYLGYSWMGFVFFFVSLAPFDTATDLAPAVARALGVGAVRVVAPLPGKHTIGIEVPNSEKESLRFCNAVFKRCTSSTTRTHIFPSYGPPCLGKRSSFIKLK